MTVPLLPGLDLEAPLTIALVGGSGDLARKKIAPAIFSLYCQGYLPERFQVIGFSRTPYSDEEYREKLRQHLTCRYTPDADCPRRMDEFLEHCYYCPGAYDDSEAFLSLYQVMRSLEGEATANRLYYMAIPPFLFVDVARAIGNAGLVLCSNEGTRWSRAVIEKPFGRDRASSDELVESMAQIFTEEQTYRIDHYLGKEVIQNLLVLRFANRLFEPVWNNAHVQSVEIDFREDIGAEGRAGYFDRYGIVRDVVQNHLLEAMALTAMERPRRFEAQPLLDEKVRVLRAVRPVTLDDTVVGQYTATNRDGRRHEAYREEDGLEPDTRTPTYAMTVLHVDNERWRGVPFILSAGKGLESRKTEIRVNFRPLDSNLFESLKPQLRPNVLTIRVQPGESITYAITNKRPGNRMELVESGLDLQYHEAFDETVPEAYESLLLEVLRGDKGLFIRADELRAAWDIFTPVLHELEEKGIEPEPYEFGSQGPQAAESLAARYGLT